MSCKTTSKTLYSLFFPTIHPFDGTYKISLENNLGNVAMAKLATMNNCFCYEF